MAKTKMNFRLSEDALMSLARLSGLWGCDRTAVIERALAEVDPVSVPINEAASKVLHNSSNSKASKIARGEPLGSVEVQPPDTLKPKTRVLTREEREAKIDAFQRKMARKK